MQADVSPPGRDDASEVLSSAVTPPPVGKVASDSVAMVLPADQSASTLAAVSSAASLLSNPRSKRGQNGTMTPVWQRIEALEEWVRMQLAHYKRQHELKIEEAFHDMQERLLALEGDRPKLEMGIAQLGGSVKGIVEQLTNSAQHAEALDSRHRQWRRALEEHVREELAGAERVREARLQEFHTQLTELESKLRSRRSLEDAIRTEFASSKIAEMESGALKPQPIANSAGHRARSLLVAAAGSEVCEKLESLDCKLQNCASNARSAAANQHEALQRHSAKLSELQELVQGTGGCREQLERIQAGFEAHARQLSALEEARQRCENVTEEGSELGLQSQETTPGVSIKMQMMKDDFEAARVEVHSKMGDLQKDIVGQSAQIVRLRMELDRLQTKVGSAAELAPVLPSGEDDHAVLELRKEVTSISARLATFEQAMQETSDDEEEARVRRHGGSSSESERGADLRQPLSKRDLDDIGETFSLHESEDSSLEDFGELA